MTPSLRGLRATMLPGVRPSIRLAADPTATTLSVLLSMATTDGSESTIPCPLTNTSVFAVPRSIATSRPNSPPNIRDPSSVSNDPAPPIRRLEYSVLLHTKVPVAQDHVIQDVDTVPTEIVGNAITSFLVFKSTATKISRSRLAIRPLKRPSTSSREDITGRPGLRTLPNLLPNSTAARVMHALASPIPCNPRRSCTETQDCYHKALPHTPDVRSRRARGFFR